jgi:hypothetical protein
MYLSMLAAFDGQQMAELTERERRKICLQKTEANAICWVNMW